MTGLPLPDLPFPPKNSATVGEHVLVQLWLSPCRLTPLTAYSAMCQDGNGKGTGISATEGME